jgi:hypothetical protein
MAFEPYCRAVASRSGACQDADCFSCGWSDTGSANVALYANKFADSSPLHVVQVTLQAPTPFTAVPSAVHNGSLALIAPNDC